MDLDELEKLITDFKIPGQTAKVTSDLFNVVKSLFAYTKKLQTEIDLLKGQTKPPSRPLMSSLFSTKTPDEQTSEKLLLHTVHREIREISNIECNAIISGTDYTSEDADKAIVDDVLTAIGSTVRHVKHIRRIQNKDKTPSKKLLLTFNEAETKQEVCQWAYKLRKAGKEYNNIYLNEDRTKAQRAIDKELRDERTRLNNALTETTYTTTINDQTVTQTRRLGDEGSSKFYWAIRNDRLKKIIIDVN